MQIQMSEFEVATKERQKFFMLLKDGKIFIPLRRGPWGNTGIKQNSIVIGKDYKPTRFTAKNDPFVSNFEHIYNISGFVHRLSLRHIVFRNTHCNYKFDKETKTAFYDLSNFKQLVKHHINMSTAARKHNKIQDFINALDNISEKNIMGNFSKVSPVRLTDPFIPQEFDDPFPENEDKEVKEQEISKFHEEKHKNYQLIIDLIKSNIDIDNALLNRLKVDEEFRNRANSELETENKDLKSQVKDIFSRLDILKNRVNM